MMQKIIDILEAQRAEEHRNVDRQFDEAVAAIKELSAKRAATDVSAPANRKMVCRKCRRSKWLNDFYDDPTTKIGKRSVCKDCTKKRKREVYLQGKRQALKNAVN